MVLRAEDPTSLLPEFLPFFMQSDLFMEHAVEHLGQVRCRQRSTGQRSRRYEFALPPLEEQRRIAMR